ncbi:MAG TPA: nucleotidyltransferase family protein [Firmicutes bacterium]|nr:nucleotidyltransferase family protein [Bacillota bacterium]
MQVGAIVPAAGLSRRMGRPKPCLPWGSGTLLEHIVRTLEASSAKPIVAVLGHEVEMVRQAHSALFSRPNIIWAYNPDYATDEMLSSVKAGLRSLLNCPQSPALSAFLVCPVDMPLITADVVAELLRRHEELPERILIPVYNGRKGHPVLFPMRFIHEILELPPASPGLRAVRDAHPLDVGLVPVTCEGILIDLDTPADYQKWHASVKLANTRCSRTHNT